MAGGPELLQAEQCKGLGGDWETGPGSLGLKSGVTVDMSGWGRGQSVKAGVLRQTRARLRVVWAVLYVVLVLV